MPAAAAVAWAMRSLRLKWLPPAAVLMCWSSGGLVIGFNGLPLVKSLVIVNTVGYDAVRRGNRVRWTMDEILEIHEHAAQPVGESAE